MYVQCNEWIQLLHNHYLQYMGQKWEAVGQEPNHAILANFLFPYTYYIPEIVRKYFSFVYLFLVAALGKWCNVDKNSGNNCFLRILAKVKWQDNIVTRWMCGVNGDFNLWEDKKEWLQRILSYTIF